MLVFWGKSTEQQNFSFIFIPIWPTSKLQAVYFFLKCLRVLTWFSVSIYILALRIVITFNWTVFRLAHQYKTITVFFVTEEVWYTEVWWLIIYFESSPSFRSSEKSKKLFTMARYTGNEIRSYRYGYMTSQWINRRFHSSETHMIVLNKKKQSWVFWRKCVEKFQVKIIKNYNWELRFLLRLWNVPKTNGKWRKKE